MENIILILVIISLVIACTAIGMLFFIGKKNNVVVTNQGKLVNQLKQQNTILRSEVEELRSGVMNMGKRILQLEQLNQQLSQHQQELAQNQQELQFTDPESKIYSRAVKMVKLGAPLEEIMQECELPRAEAELLLSLHRQ